MTKASWQSSRHDPWRRTLPYTYGAAYCLDCDEIIKIGYGPLAATTNCTTCGRSMIPVNVTIDHVNFAGHHGS